MRSLRASGFGRVMHPAEIHTADSGNPMLLMTIEFEERTLSKGTLYAQRVQFRSFAPEDIKNAEKLGAGVLVAFDGDCDAVAEQSPTGWWYANPRVTGRILTIIDTKQEALRA